MVEVIQGPRAVLLAATEAELAVSAYPRREANANTVAHFHILDA